MTSAIIQDVLSKAPSLQGYAVWCVRMRRQKGNSAGTSLEVMLENAETKNLTVEECLSCSHKVKEILLENGMWTEDCSLEVSSPGIQRPLMTPQHYEQYIGHMVTIYLTQEVQRLKTVKGILDQVMESGILITVEESESQMSLAWSMIKNGALYYDFEDRSKGDDQGRSRRERKEDNSHLEDSSSQPADVIAFRPRNDADGERSERRPRASGRSEGGFPRKSFSDRPSRPPFQGSRSRSEGGSERPSRPFEKRTEGGPARPFERRSEGAPGRSFERRPEGSGPARPFERRSEGGPARSFERRPEGERSERRPGGFGGRPEGGFPRKSFSDRPPFQGNRSRISQGEGRSEGGSERPSRPFERRTEGGPARSFERRPEGGSARPFERRSEGGPARSFERRPEGERSERRPGGFGGRPEGGFPRKSFSDRPSRPPFQGSRSRSEGGSERPSRPFEKRTEGGPARSFERRPEGGPARPFARRPEGERSERRPGGQPEKRVFGKPRSGPEGRGKFPGSRGPSDGGSKPSFRGEKRHAPVKQTEESKSNHPPRDHFKKHV